MIFDIPGSNKHRLPAIEMPEEMLKLMLKGDERCKHKINDEIVKIHAEKNGDVHLYGDKGVIRGSIWKEKPDVTPWGLEHGCYLVEWKRSKMFTLVVGNKIKAL